MNDWQLIDETRRGKERILLFMQKSLLGTQREERLSKSDSEVALNSVLDAAKSVAFFLYLFYVANYKENPRVNG
jgi:hypothetical protein